MIQFGCRHGQFVRNGGQQFDAERRTNRLDRSIKRLGHEPNNHAVGLDAGNPGQHLDVVPRNTRSLTGDLQPCLLDSREFVGVLRCNSQILRSQDSDVDHGIGFGFDGVGLEGRSLVGRCPIAVADSFGPGFMTVQLFERRREIVGAVDVRVGPLLTTIGTVSVDDLLDGRIADIVDCTESTMKSARLFG